MVMGRGCRGISRPFLARSQSFCPLTFKAEYMGGTWRISPRNWGSTPSSCSRVTEASCLESTVPVESSVSVVRPGISSVS